MALHEGYVTPFTNVPVTEAPANPPHDSGESDEDSLQAALLPRGTIVKITGNNRTRQALIGLTAVVKRAVGLGGWHYIVLSTGEEIKLQRNALLVLETPTGNEQYFSEEEQEEEARRLAAEQQQQRQRALQRQAQLEALEDSRARHRRAPRPLIADEYPGGYSALAPQHPQQQPAAVRVPRVEATRTLHQPRINLAKLDIAALKRYRSYYRLPEPGAGSSKDDLVSLVAQHFAEQTVDEAQVISHFLRAARRHSATGTTWR